MPPIGPIGVMGPIGPMGGPIGVIGSIGVIGGVVPGSPIGGPAGASGAGGPGTGCTCGLNCGTDSFGGDFLEKPSYWLMSSTRKTIAAIRATNASNSKP